MIFLQLFYEFFKAGLFAIDWRPCPFSSRFRCGIRGSRRMI